MASDRNTQLMKAMGSKSGRYDPEPPAQWQWQLEHGTPAERLLAWLKSKTVAFGHGTAYATEEGKALYLEQAATDLGWSEKTAQNVAYGLVSEGRIRLDRNNKRIYLRAEVVPPTGATEVGRNLGEIPITYNGQFPAYVIDFIQKAPPEIKDVVIREYGAFVEWHNEVLADTVSAARAILTRVENTILERHGIEKPATGRPAKETPRAVQLQLLEVPDFVHNSGEPITYTGKTASVRNQNGLRTEPASLYSSDTDKSTDIDTKGKGGEKVGSVGNQAGPPPPSPPNGKRNGHSTAVAVVPKPDPEVLGRFEQWRMIRNQCKKPVPDEDLELRRQCFEAFASYSAGEQERIILDTGARIESWNAEKLHFLKTALEYLQSRIWKSDPVQHVAPRLTAAERKREREREEDRQIADMLRQTRGI